MLTLQLKSGEYITIGDDIVVQVFQVGQQIQVKVDAPREMTILRGEVLERTEARPGSVHNRAPKSPSRVKRDQNRDFKRSARAD